MFATQPYLQKMKHLFNITILSFVLAATAAYAQSDEKKEEIRKDSKEAKSEFLKKDAGMSKFFDSAHGYVIFPNVGKGGLGVGAASGNGVAFENGKFIGYAKLTQVSVGFQAGGQAFREVVFFESADDMERFKNNKIEFSAQASAVAASAGASADSHFVEGIAIFTMAKGGLMYEASVSGQKLKYKPE